MGPIDMLEYYRGQSDEALKLETLKIRTTVRALKENRDKEPDEYFKERLKLEIERQERTLTVIDDIWYYRHGLHMPKEHSDDE